MLSNYEKGDIVEGIVTNVLPYGVFVHIDAETTGLIHISEIKNGFVSDINKFASVGQRLIVKVLEVDHDRKQLKLSLKSAPKQINHYRSRHSRNLTQKKQLLPPNKIGFASLEAKLPEWVKESLNND